MIFQQSKKNLDPPNRVVLLGGTGFIGQAIERRLRAAQIPTLSVGSRQIDLAAKNAPSKLSNILRPTDSIVMLSAITPDRHQDTDALNKNLRMMENLCIYMEQATCPYFVYFSSDAVYGSTEALITETTETKPDSSYGSMHQVRELMAKTIDAPLLVLRPTLVYGCGDSHSAYGPSYFFKTGRDDNVIWLFGDGSDRRDYIHVTDVAEILYRSFVDKTVGTLNLVFGKSISFLELANLIAQNLDGDTKILSKPRLRPISNKHFDNSYLTLTFSGLSLTPIQEGILSYKNE